MNEAIHEAVQQKARERAAAIEEACERSLLDPQQRGVAVYEVRGGAIIELSEEVPWGSIYFHTGYGTIYGGA